MPLRAMTQRQLNQPRLAAVHGIVLRVLAQSEKCFERRSALKMDADRPVGGGVVRHFDTTPSKAPRLAVWSSF